MAEMQRNTSLHTMYDCTSIQNWRQINMRINYRLLSRDHTNDVIDIFGSDGDPHVVRKQIKYQVDTSEILQYAPFPSFSCDFFFLPYT